MAFNSIAFALFYLAFFPLYWSVNRRASKNARNASVLLASYLFYGWWDWRFLGLIALSSATDFWIGLAMGRQHNPGHKKMLLLLSLAVNLGILGFFKYYNFFAESLQDLLGLFGWQLDWPTLHIILPVGISFYTFQTLSYTIDIYRGRLQPTRDPLSFFAFVAFFPQLVAGPIERAANLLPQFHARKAFQESEVVGGLRLVVWGMFKKVVIADNLGPIVDALYAGPESYGAIGVFIGALLFSFQIYCDFSGYSDIAIGVARTLGFRLSKNFETPYLAGSFREFWQRWHISLSTWFRDYVYIPLGGSRVPPARWKANTLITFVVSGLWHGAAFTFILWGFLHGFALLAERRSGREARLPSWLLFLLVSLFWLPFRAEDLGQLGALAGQLGNPLAGWETCGHLLLELLSGTKVIWFGLVFAGFLWMEGRIDRSDFDRLIASWQKPLRRAVYYLLILCILLLGNFANAPQFIYFQF